MAQSLNTKVDFVCRATAFHGIGQYGKIMAGDRAIEFYDERNVENYVQIPWEEVDFIVADVVMGGKWIPRFEIQTKGSGSFRFSAGKDTKPLLGACKKHVPPERMVRALSAAQKISRGIRARMGK